MPDGKVTFDVFLSHNSKDKPAVRQIAVALRDRRGLKVWLDELENIIRTVRGTPAGDKPAYLRGLVGCL